MAPMKPLTVPCFAVVDADGDVVCRNEPGGVWDSVPAVFLTRDDAEAFQRNRGGVVVAALAEVRQLVAKPSTDARPA